MTTALQVSSSAVLNPPSGTSIQLAPTDIVYRSSRYNEAAMVEVTAVPFGDVTDEELLDLPLTTTEARQDETVTEDGEIIDPNEGIPVPETTMLVTINGTRLVSGAVEDITPDGEGLVTVTAFDAVRKLLQNSMTAAFQNEHVNEAFRQAFEAANIPAAEDDPGTITGRPTYRIETEDAIAEHLEGPQGQAGMAPFITSREFTSAPCAEVMDTLARDVGWYWYTTTENVITVVPELDPIGFEPEYITDASAGKQSPPYQRVLVIGGRDELAAFSASDSDSAPPPDEDGGDDSDTSNDNTGRSQHLLGREPVRGDAGEGTPVFKHTDSSITTQTNAQRVAEGILEEFQRQQATGTITVVGDPEMQPLNAVTLPDELGGETYAIGTVAHTLNVQSGYTTEIGCEGVIDYGDDPGNVGDGDGGDETDPQDPGVDDSDGNPDGGPIDLDGDGEAG